MDKNKKSECVVTHEGLSSQAKMHQSDNKVVLYIASVAGALTSLCNYVGTNYVGYEGI